MALSWEDLKTQIDCQKSPFCVSWKTVNSSGDIIDGHMGVVSAYKILDGVNMVFILNPLASDRARARWITYAAYVSAPDSSYLHYDDYFNIRNNDAGR
jgi:hypothetical protein